MYCSYCGKEINENVKFCPYCNNKINAIQDEIAVKKKQSDSENQPTSAILGFVLAILLCIYGVVCLKEEADKTVTNIGLSCIIIGAVIFPILTFIRFLVFKTKHGLNGIGYLVYLINLLAMILELILIGATIILAVMGLV